MNDKRTLRIILVGAGVLLTLILWLTTVHYNLQGGFRKKIDTAKPVQASGQMDEIEIKIKTLKEKFKNNREEIDTLLEQTKK